MFSNPLHNIPHFGIKPGMKIADFGAGSGAYAIALAQAVGDEGIVYAVDIQKDLLDSLVREAQKAGYHTIKPVWGDLEKVGGTNLASGGVDIVLLSNILFQIKNKRAVIQEAMRITHQYGKIIVIDWADSFGNIGPPKDMVFTRDEALSLCADMQCALVSEFSPGNHHYGLIFEKNMHVKQTT